MKINAIGSDLTKISGVQNSKSVTKSKFDEFLKTEVKNNTTEISAEEKSFFQSMYPNNANEIISYKFPEANIRLGTVFDKRG